VLLFYHTLNVYQTRQGTKTTNQLKIKTYFLSLTEVLTNLSTVALLKFTSRKGKHFKLGLKLQKIKGVISTNANAKTPKRGRDGGFRKNI